MYILLSEQTTVTEIIPEEDPVFPGVPVAERYAPDFVRKLLRVPEGTEVSPNWVYDPEIGTFSPPPEPELPEAPEIPDIPEGPETPTIYERMEALEAETAALTAAVEKGLSL